jgi:hypothetical protein
MLKIATENDRDTSSEKFTDIYRQISPTLLPGVSAGICQRALVDESGITRTEIETNNRSENGYSTWKTSYDITRQW